VSSLTADKTGCKDAAGVVSNNYKITVASGSITGISVAANSAVAIHIGQKVTASTPTPPTVTGISPKEATQNYQNVCALTLKVTGTNLTANTKIKWGSTELTTTYMTSPTESPYLTAPLTGTQLGTIGSFTVSVSDPEDGASTTNATFTVANPSFSGYDDKAYDGQILESAKDSKVGGTVSATTTSFKVGDDAQKREIRGFVSFNTAILPDTAVLGKAELKLYCTAFAGSLGTMYVDVEGPYFGTALTLVSSDWQDGVSDDKATKVSSRSTFTKSALNSFLITTTGLAFIKNDNHTQFRLYYTANDSDVVSDYVSFASGEATTASQRPTLLIHYYVP
jgi:hypothetical protein